MFAKLKKSTANFIAGIFVVAYIFLFLPALVYTPLIGGAAFDMSVWAGFLCILCLLTVPLSMPVSIYFIFLNYEKKNYLKMLFCCFLPGCFCILSFLFTSLIIHFHCLIEC